ncbi:MAG: ferrous iron transport protein B [Anaerolineales bacterium]|nr:ferrous iron transport protein B [Anaerolineales bacterium]
MQPADPTTFAINYGPDIEAEISYLQTEIHRYPHVCTIYPDRWLAIKLLERDLDLQQKLLPIEGGPAVLTHAQLALARLEAVYQDDVDTAIADRRYNWIHELVQETIKRPLTDSYTLSDKIDKIITHRILGIPIFIALMWVVFKLTADVSAPFLDWIDSVVNGPVSRWVTAVIGWIGLGGTWVESLFVDGIIAGVGGILVFVPVLVSLYFALAVLEGSGYMARAALVMDRVMTKIGLHGKSFLPLMVGFGCSVPAIYATRTLDNDKDRILTGLLVPFMSCGARLPVYVLFAAIFFPDKAGLVIFGLYLLGIITAMVLGLILKRTLFQTNEPTALVMELPPYRMPTLKNIWYHMWQRIKSFLEDAWTIIMLTSILIWLLMAIPVGGNGPFDFAQDRRFADISVDESAFATISGWISPIMQPLGFGNWESSGALVTGFVAKEVVVSTLSQVYGFEETEVVEPTTFGEDVIEIGTGFAGATADTIKSLPLIVGINLFAEEAEDDSTALMNAIRTDLETASGGHGALAALAFMVFVLIYTPCMVAVAAEKQELGVKWAWVSIVGQLVLAWVMALAVFQGGVFLGLG